MGIFAGGSSDVDDVSVEYNASNQLAVKGNFRPVTSGSATGTSIDLQSLTVRKRYFLSMIIDNSSGSTADISIRVCGASDANYDYYWVNAGTLTETTGQTSCLVLRVQNGRKLGVFVEFYGDPNTTISINLINPMNSVGQDSFLYMGGFYRGTATGDFDEINIVSSQSVTIDYALYYDKSLEDAA